MKIAFFQPILTAYRLPLLKAIAAMPDVVLSLYSDVATEDYGLESICPENLPFSWITKNDTPAQQSFFHSITKALSAVESNDVIIHFADFKHISLFVCLIFSKLKDKKVFLHGQGGYKKRGLLQKLVYNCTLALAEGYICYNDFSKKNLNRITFNFLHKKIHVVDNSIYLSSRSIPSGGKDVLFIGRLREGCGIELLLHSAQLAGLNVRVVGWSDHNFIDRLKVLYPNFDYYGAVYDETTLFSIAQYCFVGAYGGDAGLSVVHYMAYSLPVIVHDDLYKHMGPEPSYVVDGVNGLTFKRNDGLSLKNALTMIYNDKTLQSKLSRGAAETFHALNKIPMHQKFAQIIGIN